MVRLRVHVSHLRLQLSSILANQTPMRPKTKIVLALLIFIASFTTKSLHAVDVSPMMYTHEQPGLGMTNRYDFRAVSIAEGHGCLLPDNLEPSDTELLAYPPGYSIFLASIYSLLGRDYFKVQLLQNLLNSISPVLIFLIVGELLTWRIGAIAGLLAAVSHHLSYYSNFILPDALCALPILSTVYLLVRAMRDSRGSYWLCALAGVMLGLSVWLRPNSMLMGPFLILVLGVASAQPWRVVKLATVMTLVSFLAVAPITIRNYLIYHEFVPVTNHLGVVLWEGIGDASGDRFGAVATDDEVAEQEAVMYNDERYAGSWAAPDGIRRDRDRITRSLAIITHHPLWYAGVMFERMGELVKYSAQAPLVFRTSDTKLLEAANRAKQAEEIAAEQQPIISDNSSLVVGKSIWWMRPLVRALQRITKETVFAFMLIGIAIMFGVNWRFALFIMIVPLYYLLFQSAMHIEFRYALPMHYFLFVFAATTWVVIGVVLWNGMRRLGRSSLVRHWSRRSSSP